MSVYEDTRVVEIPGLDKIPLLKYLKEPAMYKDELYDRYPLGGEYGWFAFVYSIKSFVYWEPETREWALLNIGSENINLITYMLVEQEMYVMGPSDAQTIKCTIMDGYNRDITLQFGQLDVYRDSGDYYTDQMWDQLYGINKGFEFTLRFNDLNYREGSTSTRFTLIATRDGESVLSNITIGQ